MTGNIYANNIEELEAAVSSTDSILMSNLTENGLRFAPKTEAMINEFNTVLSDSAKSTPFLILDLGDKNSKSSIYSRWIATSSVPYALVRPWWFGTLSGTILDGVTIAAQGRLYPGICPFRPTLKPEDLYRIQNLIYANVSSNTKFVAFVGGVGGASEFQDGNDYTITPQIGMFNYSNDSTQSEYWLTFLNQTEGYIGYANNDYTQEPLALVTVILSVVVALFIAYLGFELTRYAIIFLYRKLLSFSEHLKDYSDLGKTNKEASKGASKHEPAEKSWYSLKDFLGDVPSLSEFIDYLVFILHGQFSNSIARYYQLLFRKSDITSSDSNLNNELIKFSEVKVLYEQFCFLNYLTEMRLNEPKYLSLLAEYDYELITREDQQTEVFVGINIKNYKNFAVERSEGEEWSDSLDLYQKNFERTAFTEDQVEVELFTKIYKEFCNYNKLEYIEVSPSLMEERYRISTLQVPQQFIARRHHNTLELHSDDDDHRGLLNRRSNLFFWRSRKPKDYIIDTVKLENHMKLIMNDIEDLTEEEVKEASLDLIWHPGVWLWDGLVVLLHLFLITALTIPLLLFVILNQAEYTSWSLIDPKLLIRWKDLTHDPSRLFLNILFQTFPWNATIVTFVICFFFFKIIGLFLYYTTMTFPVNRLLQKDKTQARRFRIFLKLLEWISFSVVIIGYFVYIGLFMMWLLLGAFISPNSFLPFASAAATFATFVVAKYKAFKSIYDKGREAIMDYLTAIFTEFINSVANKLMNEIKGVTGSVTDDAKKFLQNDMVQVVKAKIAETGLVNPNIIEDFEKKVQQMNGQNALSGALDVIRDPSILAQRLKNLKGEMEKALVSFYHIISLILL